MGLSILFLTFSLYLWGSQSPADSGTVQGGPCEEEKIAESHSLHAGRVSWWKEAQSGLANPPPGAFSSAKRHLHSMKNRAASPVSDPGWEAMGPFPLLDGVQGYSGRVTAIAPHPSNGAIVYLSGARGGVWKTTDGGNHWIPLTDDLGTPAVAALAVDPLHPDTVIAGTGDPYMGCGDYYGTGILRSSDGGFTWETLAETLFSDTAITKILIHPDRPGWLWVANGVNYPASSCTGATPDCGVWLSRDHGLTWLPLLTGEYTAQPLATVTDLVQDPIDPDILFAAVRYSGIWKTENGGTTWTRLLDGLPTEHVGRIDIAQDPTSLSTIYSVFENAGTGRPLGIFKSFNAGLTWFELPAPSGSCQYWDLSDLCTYPFYDIGSCWYDLLLEAGPTGQVWVGGIGLWESTDGGQTWVNECRVDMHVDYHAMAFGPDGERWVGSDGGIFYADPVQRVWISRNETLGLTQFYPGASLHPTRASRMLAGNQDNGTLLYQGQSRWIKVGEGDGGATAYDSRSPDTTWYTSYQYLNIMKTTNGGYSYLWSMYGLTDANTTRASFHSPFTLCPADPSVLVAGSDNVWISTNGAESWSSIGPDPLDPLGFKIRVLAFSETDSTCNTLFAGTIAGTLYRTLNRGQNWDEIGSGLPGGPMNQLVAFRNDPAIWYVVLGGYGHPHIYRTDDIQANQPEWSEVGLSLPDTPFYTILLDPLNSNILYAGCDLGLFISMDGGLSWSLDPNHPAIPVRDLKAVENGSAVISFTFGRGAFRLRRDALVPRSSEPLPRLMKSGDR